MVYTKDEISALADVIVKHPDTWVITDDIYNRMVFDGIGYHNFVHARPELRDRVVFMDSLSKTYGMPGWRAGFMVRSEEHTSELQSLMRISYAVFCLKKKNNILKKTIHKDNI